MSLFIVACAPVVDVYKMGNEYIQDARSRKLWGPNWQRVTYCWKLENGFCPKEDTRVETANKIGMESVGERAAVGFVSNLPWIAAFSLIPSNSNRMTQSVGGLTINETFSTKYVGK
jgi:hypothetical protein